MILVVLDTAADTVLDPFPAFLVAAPRDFACSAAYDPPLLVS